MPRKHILTRLVPTLMGLVVAGCSLDKLNPNLEPETGTGNIYTLVGINASTVPVVIVQGQTTLEVKKGALTLAADSTWILSYVVRQTNGGGESHSIQTSRGNYGLRGAVITMRLATDTVTRFSGAYSLTDVSVRDISQPSGDLLIFKR